MSGSRPAPRPSIAMIMAATSRLGTADHVLTTTAITAPARSYQPAIMPRSSPTATRIIPAITQNSSV